MESGVIDLVLPGLGMSVHSKWAIGDREGYRYYTLKCCLTVSAMLFEWLLWSQKAQSD